MGFEDYVVVICQFEFPESDGYVVALQRNVLVCCTQVIRYAGVIWHCVRKELGGKQALLRLQFFCEFEFTAKQRRMYGQEASVLPNELWLLVKIILITIKVFGKSSHLLYVLNLGLYKSPSCLSNIISLSHHMPLSWAQFSELYTDCRMTNFS